MLISKVTFNLFSVLKHGFFLFFVFFSIHTFCIRIMSKLSETISCQWPESGGHFAACSHTLRPSGALKPEAQFGGASKAQSCHDYLASSHDRLTSYFRLSLFIFSNYIQCICVCDDAAACICACFLTFNHIYVPGVELY